MLRSVSILAALAALFLSACAAPPTARDTVEPVTLSYLRGDDSPSEALRAVAEDSRHSYLRARIFMPGAQRQAGESAIVNAASATMLDARGLAVTAAHIALAETYDAQVIDAEGRMHTAEILDVSPARELALLRFDPAEGADAPKVPPSAPQDGLSPGDPVFAIGTPDNEPGIVAQGRVAETRTSRRISYGEYGFDNAIVVAMDAVPGFSGGPLFDAEGRLLGIVASFDLDSRPSRHMPAGRTYVIPIADVLAYLAETTPR